jgi:hypothetical protein
MAACMHARTHTRPYPLNRYQPWAKFASVVFTLGLTLAYNRLLDHYSKPQLFYLVGAVYTVRWLPRYAKRSEAKPCPKPRCPPPLMVVPCSCSRGLCMSCVFMCLHSIPMDGTHACDGTAHTQVIFLVIASLLPDPTQLEDAAAAAAAAGEDNADAVAAALPNPGQHPGQPTANRSQPASLPVAPWSTWLTYLLTCLIINHYNARRNSFLPSFLPSFTTPRTGRLLGWASYLAIESYGSLTVAMFWAFTNSSVHLEGAKSVYGLILAGAQVRAVPCRPVLPYLRIRTRACMAG